MPINFNTETKVFHLTNGKVSYILQVLKNGHLGHLYFGEAIKDSQSFAHMLQLRACVLAPCAFENNLDFSLGVIKQEYPCYGTGDYRESAYQLRDETGGRISDFKYISHEIHLGKKKIQGLPATYGEDEEITSLEIRLYDEILQCNLILIYNLFEDLSVVTRSAKFENVGTQTIFLERAMSCSVDFYDSDFTMVQLDGAWSRERHKHERELQYGIQSVSSTRGASGATHNPFLALRRHETTEYSGEVFGFSLLYSGNFLAQAQVDTYAVTRVTMGIHPFEFEWCLKGNTTFSTPEVAMVYSNQGMNGMSQTYHDLYRNNLMRGAYKGKTRPILINNWEATYFDFTEESILAIATKARELGVELFVLDDGWFGVRNNDTTSLGDWKVNLEKLPNGVTGLADKITALGMKFGLWFEPEMVNEISELYRTHPEWAISTPNRKKSYGRNQFVLDFTNEEVVDYIFGLMYETLSTAKISYVKWDMNRNITEAFAVHLPANQQKEFFHRYILGVYDLYERLLKAFPDILFESCASGGARFDAGMLYYAPQAWTSDDTDAIERLKIQAGTSLVYPVVSMGSHVSAIPNHQVSRETSLKMRADVAYFGTFGYELDVNQMSEAEQQEVRQQIQFFKEHRELIQLGDFYRLEKGERNVYSWMVVSKDKRKAILGYYKVLATPNPALKKYKLQGLDPNQEYVCKETNMSYYGDELMNFGFLYDIEFTGLLQSDNFLGEYHSGTNKGDFTSYVYVFEAK